MSETPAARWRQEDLEFVASPGKLSKTSSQIQIFSKGVEGSLEA
jgi:hypothetical protein